MKKALIIVAVVAGYSLLEALLLLRTLVTNQGYLNPSLYQIIVLGGQFLLIPGLAVLLSRIMYGPYHWGRRTLAILAAGPLTIFAFLVLFASFAVFLEWISKKSWASGIMDTLAATLLLLALCIFVLGLFLVLRRVGKWGVQLEAKRWLAERQSGADSRQIKWRTRGIRIAACIPLVIVLLVFLFLPETWGIISHLSQPRSGNLPGYQVPIPITWIVLLHGNQPEPGKSSVSGLVGRGIGRGVRPYLRTEFPFSYWYIGTEQYSQSADNAHSYWIPKECTITGQPVVMIGNENVACLEHSCPEHFGTSAQTFIECSGAGRLYAGFNGEKRNVPAFYKMISGITPAK